MRIKITFVIEKDNVISLNYNLPLCAVIYKYLSNSDYNFSKHLHDKGFEYDNRLFKLFVFSDLNFKSLGIIKGRIKIAKGRIYWHISSPVDEFVKHLVNGLFKQGNEVILDNQKLNIEKVEVLQSPEFNNRMKFSMMSPLVVSTKKEINEKLKTYYFRYNDDFSEPLLQNLKRKYYLIHGKENKYNELKLIFDESYIRYRLQKNKSISKLKHIIKWDKKNKEYIDIKIKGIMCPFEIETDSELIRVGYECGFGEKNSTGFGMVEKTN